jgi:hypothetical protein
MKLQPLQIFDLLNNYLFICKIILAHVSQPIYHLISFLIISHADIIFMSYSTRYPFLVIKINILFYSVLILVILSLTCDLTRRLVLCLFQ